MINSTVTTDTKVNLIALNASGDVRKIRTVGDSLYLVLTMSHVTHTDGKSIMDMSTEISLNIHLIAIRKIKQNKESVLTNTDINALN